MQKWIMIYQNNFLQNSSKQKNIYSCKNPTQVCFFCVCVYEFLCLLAEKEVI